MKYLIEIWLIEIVKTIVKFFFNPLFYWFFIFIFILSIQRIKQERRFFGIKIFGIYQEWKGIILISLMSGIVLSIVTVGTGFVFNYDIIAVLMISIFIMSLTFNPAYLSPVYTIGLTYIILLFLPFISAKYNYTVNLPANILFTQLTILLGILLFVEAILVKKLKNNQIPPQLKLSDRGVWVGVLNSRKVTLIPFLLFIPSNSLGFISDFWPYFNIGETQYSLIIVPFILGFKYKVVNEQLYKATDKIAMRTLTLGIIILILAIGSIYIPALSFLAIIIAIIGKEFISINFKLKSNKGEMYYRPLDNGLKILAIIPNSPADRLNLLVGETIVKVNNQKINTETKFYSALQHKSASFKLDVLNNDGEVRFISGSLYEFEDHNLGLIFPKEPYKV